jgi:hypothetical protein
VHGSPFVTNDLDICYRDDPENLRRLTGVLARWSAYPRGWEAGLPFTMDVRALRTTPLMTLVSSEGEIDVLDRILGVGNYDAVAARSEQTSAFGLEFQVLGLAALISAKRATGRPKDSAQLPTLEALEQLRGEG